MKPVRIGCSGWSYEHWKQRFYPKGMPTTRWLEHYAKNFDTVEVNSTFYRLASQKAVESWVESTPGGFLFTVKASRFLTHVKRLKDIEQGIERFYAPLAPLADSGKLGPTLWQLPETERRDDDRLLAALDLLPPGRHCFEFRHDSWFAKPVYDILRHRGIALVIGIHPERPFQDHRLTADWTFLRFHYGLRGRGGNFSRSELEEWRRRIASWRSRAEVLAYFNNDWEGYAIANARWLQRRLS